MSRVAVIGAGPSGLAIVRALLHDPIKFKVTVYEARTQPGGVWAYTGHGPVYRDLDTNIFKDLMEYRGFPFAAELPTYPGREDVYQYVMSYYEKVRHAEPGSGALSFRFGSAVTDIVKHGAGFAVHSNGAADEFDFVVVASGHFEKPLIPAIDGLEAYMRANPGKVLHTRYYDNPDRYKSQKVLVVGNGSSGTDINIQLRGTARAPIHVSRRHETAGDAVFGPADVTWRPEARQISADGTVTFVDGSTDLFDAIILATGYLYSVPFLENLSASCPVPLLDPKELRVPNVHKYIFAIGEPRIAFVALNQQVVPMPLSECQAAVIARVFGGRLALPPRAAMLAEEADTVAAKGSQQGYLRMGYPNDVEYMRMLTDWAAQAPEGFRAERWGPEKADMRSRVAKAKLADYARKLEEARRHSAQ